MAQIGMYKMRWLYYTLFSSYTSLIKTPMAGDTSHTIDESALGVTSIFSKSGSHAVLDHVADPDEEVLTALGYKQEFKRFGLCSYSLTMF